MKAFRHRPKHVLDFRPSFMFVKRNACLDTETKKKKEKKEKVTSMEEGGDDDMDDGERESVVVCYIVYHIKSNMVYLSAIQTRINIQ